MKALSKVGSALGLLSCLLLSFVLSPVSADARDLNDELLAAVKTFPEGGGWDGRPHVVTALGRAITHPGGHITVAPESWTPSFCTGAVYLAFLRMVGRFQREGSLQLPAAVVESLMVRGQPDGTDAWGWINSNGPGASRLFHVTGLGTNFIGFSEAKAGDLVKIWWNDFIGPKESGHLAVFLSLTTDASGKKWIRYWSSNQTSRPRGYSTHSVPLSRVRRAIFSRVTNLNALHQMPGLGTDAYLASLLKEPSTFEEALRMSGIADRTP